MRDSFMSPHANLWGLVLAGGEGKRLEAYIRDHYGESLPKQYMNFVGTRSMIEHTYARAERLIPRERIMTVVSQHHLRSSEVRRQLAPRAPGTVIAQPDNKDTGIGLLLPLTYLQKRCPDAIVAVFPSDHFILEEERFIDHLELAARAVWRDPSQILLLGIEAQTAETEYGYIVPAESNGHLDLCGCRKAAHFVEKPGLSEARLLVAAGALWNTMIMVFRVETLLQRVAALYPDLASRFLGLADSIGTKAENRQLEETYRSQAPLNFSKDILEKIAVRAPGAIRVLPVLQVSWSDWGSPQRLLEMKRILELRRTTNLGPITPPLAARRTQPRPLHRPPMEMTGRS